MRLAYSTMCVKIAHVLNGEWVETDNTFKQVPVCPTL